MDKKIGCAFIRVSTSKQDKFGGSLTQQKNMIERWIKLQGEFKETELIIKYWFEERASGKASNTRRRNSLTEVRKLIESGLINFVVFEKLDRLSRDQVFNLQFMRLTQKYNVDVFDVESGGNINMQDPSSRMLFSMKNMRAEDYSVDLGEKISKKQCSALVNNGKDSSTVPQLGLDAHPTKPGIYILNKCEQKIVQKIAKKFIGSCSYKDTVEYCKKNNYRTKKRKTKEKIDSEGELIPSREVGGVYFNTESLKRLLKSTKIRGVKTFGSIGTGVEKKS